MIRENIERVYEKIREVCRRVGRDPEEIILVGVTKYADPVQIRQAVEAGLRHIGENKVQQARAKFSVLQNLSESVTRHMIGHLQSNKIKQALELFDLIQSVDSLQLAREIETHAAKRGRNADILIQVNTSGEQQKFGMAPDEVILNLENIAKLTHVRVRGLMTMAPFEAPESAIRRCFRDLKSLSGRIQEHFSAGPKMTMQYLSMGMTDDFEIALEEGANMLRIGRAIFEKRNLK